MTFWILILLALGVVVTSVLPLRSARRTGLVLVGVCFISELGAAAFTTEALHIYPRWFTLSKLATLGVTLLCVGLYPLASAKRSSIPGILGISCTSFVFLTTSSHLILLIFWALAPLIVLVVNKEAEAHAKRLFLLYQGAGIIAFAAALSFSSLGVLQATQVALFLSLALRAGVFPFHSWVPVCFQRFPLPFAIAYITSAVPLIALVKLEFFLSQGSWLENLSMVAAFGAAYCSLLALGQSDAKRAIGFLVASFSSITVFGISTLSALSQSGGYLIFIVNSLGIACFGMCAAALEARRGMLTVVEPCGSISSTPFMATAFLVSGLACVGLPATAGFIAEDLLLQGAMEHVPIGAVLAVLAAAMNGMTVMRHFFFLFSGTRQVGLEPDFTLRERCALSAVLLVLITMSFFPATFVSMSSELSERARLLGNNPHQVTH